MLVPDEVRKCVAFVGADIGSGPRPVGTCSFLGVGDETWHWTYAVTAAHVIEGIRDAPGSDGNVYLRVNQNTGGAVWAVSLVDRWLMHPTDAAVDVAVLPLGSLAEFDHLAFLMTGSLTPEAIAIQGIGVGDEVFLTGLFVNHFGTERNIPIVRMGAIAAMPEEPVRTQRGPMEAYLIEARSIGGLSGSPVFVQLGIVRFIDGQVKHARTAHGPYYLLGLMHGHWQVAAQALDGLDPDALREEMVNMGIGIVVPAAKIMEVLNQPTLKDPRDEELRNRTQSIPDAGATDATA
jgi:hypothetical protein